MATYLATLPRNSKHVTDFETFEGHVFSCQASGTSEREVEVVPALIQNRS